MDSTTPTEILDDILNLVQSLPLDTQHYTKQILLNDKQIKKNKEKLKKLYKKSLKNSKDDAINKKIVKYQKSVEEAIENKIKTAEMMQNIVKKIKQEMQSKLFKIKDEIDLGIEMVENTNVLVNNVDKLQNNELESLYCICNQKSYGDMICCDSVECNVGWYHFSCVGLKSAPKGQWFCDACKKRKRTMRH